VAVGFGGEAIAAGTEDGVDLIVRSEKSLCGIAKLFSRHDLAISTS